MLSFENGRPIAKIIGGEDNSRLIHIKSEDDFSNKKSQRRKCCKCRDCSEDCYDDPCCKNCCMGESEEDLGTEIEFDDGKLVPVPNIDTRQILYISGPSGSGKSTLASKWLEMYRKLFPEKEILLFSRKPKDPVLDRLRLSRFIIDESIVENPIDFTKDLRGYGCVVFDDCNTFQNDKVKKAVSKLMHDILEVGRSFGVYCVITSHLLNPNEKKDARTIWNEAQEIAIFPKSGNRHAMEYALKNYCGFDKKTINGILNLPSRWVIIGKSFPQYVLYENGCYLT